MLELASILLDSYISQTVYMNKLDEPSIFVQFKVAGYRYNVLASNLQKFDVKLSFIRILAENIYLKHYFPRLYDQIQITFKTLDGYYFLMTLSLSLFFA